MSKGNYILVLLILMSAPIYADDLNDGISADEAVEDELQMGKNMNFIQRNAMAKALRGDKKTIVDCGTGNQIFGPGTNLNGATIVNLSNNRNTTAVCNPKNKPTTTQQIE